MDLYKGMDQLRGLSELYRQMNNPPAPEGEDVQERADTWHPDPEKDRKLGGPGANQRAREDRADAAKAAAKKKDDNKLRPGESYYDYAKRKRAQKEEFEVEVEEGYKEIDKAKENKMYRRAGNLARTALSSRGQKKQSAMDKSSKIVSAISRQKENERFSKMGDEKARSNYKEEKDPFGRPGGKHGGVGKPGGGYDKAIKANQKELDKLEKGQEPATAKRYREMKKKVDEAREPGESPKEYADRVTSKYKGKKVKLFKDYDPMKDPNFDHDKAERTRGSMKEASWDKYGRPKTKEGRAAAARAQAEIRAKDKASGRRPYGSKMGYAKKEFDEKVDPSKK